MIMQVAGRVRAQATPGMPKPCLAKHQTPSLIAYASLAP